MNVPTVLFSKLKSLLKYLLVFFHFFADLVIGEKNIFGGSYLIVLLPPLCRS